MDYDTFKRAAIRGQDEIVECPYDPSHLISRSKMQYHLVKCARQHLTVELETCPFNATHRIPRPEFQFHIAECPDRRILEAHKFQTEDEAPKANVNKLEFIQPTLPPSEENWDDDVKSTYEPDKHVSKKMVFRNLQGATKSERKQFRMEERRRVNQLTSEETEQETPPADVPLRPPKSFPKGMKTLELGSRLGMGRGLSNCKLAAGEIKTEYSDTIKTEYSDAIKTEYSDAIKTEYSDAVKFHGATSSDPAGGTGSSDMVRLGKCRGAIPRNVAAGTSISERFDVGKLRGAIPPCDPAAGPSRVGCSDVGRGRGAIPRCNTAAMSKGEFSD